MRKRIINNPSADPQQMQHPQHPQHMLHMQHRENTLHREETLHREDTLHQENTLHREDPLASPELRQNPFSAPAGYMDSFEERIMQRISSQQESLTQQESSSQQHGLGLRALLKPAIGFAASFALLFSLGYGIISLSKFWEKTPQRIARQMRDTTISSPIENNVANQTNEEATESIDAAEEYLIYYGATIATLTADATE